MGIEEAIIQKLIEASVFFNAEWENGQIIHFDTFELRSGSLRKTKNTKEYSEWNITQK